MPPENPILQVDLECRCCVDNLLPTGGAECDHPSRRSVACPTLQLCAPGICRRLERNVWTEQRPICLQILAAWPPLGAGLSHSYQKKPIRSGELQPWVHKLLCSLRPTM